MIKNYLLTTFRHLWRNKVYTFVSVFGLSLGISCTVLIALYIQDEYSFERFQDNRDNIYRLSQDLGLGETIEAAVSNVAAGPNLVNEYPEIENFVRILPSGATVKVGDNSFQEQGVFITDSTFFDIFSFELIEGDKSTVLRNPASIVLTKSLADKYFGDDDPIGQTIKVNNSMLTVDGVAADPPRNTELQFSALRPITTFPPQVWATYEGDWYRLVCYTYLLTKPGFDGEAMETKLEDFYDKFTRPFQEANGVSGVFAYHFDALNGLHFDNSREYDWPRGNKSYIYIFGAVALFILLIACINFINLSLSQSGKRSKEVGVRKTLGANNSSVRMQFLGESFLIAFIALIAGLVLVELLLPVFNDLTQKDMVTAELLSPQNLLIIIGIYVAVAALSGFYPAFVLGRMDPVRVLKGRTPQLGQHAVLRRTLVVIQFVFSLAMISGTAIVFQQFNYMKGRDLGFTKDQVALVSLPADTTLVNHSEVFRTQLAKIDGVKAVTNSGTFPGNNVGEIFFRVEKQGQLIEQGIKFMSIDENFLDLYQMELLKGRNFKRDMPTDQTSAFIVNETAAKAFGWNDDALGKRMQWGLMANNQASNDGKVVGVVKDFNFSSLHNPIEPFVFIYNPSQTQLVSFRIAAGKFDSVLDQAKNAWKEFAGIYPFNYQFVDEQFDQLYQNEERMLTIFGYFAALSILIATLGLFALSSFTIELRVKEIGVRKILGASVGQIITMLSKDFLVLVIVAALIAMPLSYYFLSDWLTTFAYKIEISIILLILVVIAAFAIAFGVIAYHGWKAARSNPIDALRFE